MIPHDLHYVFPQAAWLFPIALLIPILLFLLFEYRKRIASLYGAERYRDRIVTPRSTWNALFYALLLSAAWSFGVLALMQPQGRGRYEREGDDADRVLEEVLAEEGQEEGGPFVQRQRKAHEIIFLLDTSASMEVTDTPQGITRLQYAKEIVDEIVADSNGDSVGLYAFTSEVTPLVPPTYDTLFFRLLLRQVAINEGDVAGTDLAGSLEEIGTYYLRPSKKRRTTVVLLTDGGDTRLESLSGVEREREKEAILSRLDRLAQSSVRLFTVGLGTEEGATVPGVSFEGKAVVSSLDEQLLQALATKADGRYFFANGNSALGISRALHAVLAQDDPLLEETIVEARSGRIERTVEASQQLHYQSYFQWPLAAAVLLLAIALLLPQRRNIALAVCFLGFFSSASAVNLPEQWRSAAALYETEDYSEALAQYDVILKQELSPLEKLTAQLNRAHVLAAQGRYDEALKQLREAEPDRDAPESLQDAYRRRTAALLLRRARASADLEQGIKDANEAIIILNQLSSEKEAEGVIWDSEEKTAQLIAFAKGIAYELRERQRQKAFEEAGIPQHAATLEKLVALNNLRLEALLFLPSTATKEQGVLLATQLKGELGRLDRLREQLYAQMEKREITGFKELFSAIDTHYRSGVEALQEGLLKQARQLLGKGRLGLGFVHRATGEGVEDPIHWLLTERVIAEQKGRQQKALFSFFAEEERTAREFSQQLLSGLAEEEEDPWKSSLLYHLSEQLEKPEIDPLYAVKFYQAIGVSEEQQLLNLHDTVLQTQLEKQLAPELWEEQKRELYVVDTFLELKSAQKQEQEQKEEEKKLHAARAILEEGKGWQGVPKGVELVELIERLLLAMDPEHYLIARVKRLEEANRELGQHKELHAQAIADHRMEIEGLQAAVDQFEEKKEWEGFAKSLGKASASEQQAVAELPMYPSAARFFLGDGYAWLQAAHEEIEPPGNQPAEVLENAIGKQEWVIAMSRLLQVFPESRRSEVDAASFAQQQRVLEAIKRFAAPEQEASQIPWHRIKTLVAEGSNEAQQLLNGLTSQGWSSRSVENHAPAAVKWWKEALQLLQDPPQEQPPESQPEENSPDENEQEQPPEQQNAQEQKESSREQEQLLQAIQQMEQEDAPLFEEPEREPKRGLRPW